MPQEGSVYKANLHFHTKEEDSGAGFMIPLLLEVCTPGDHGHKRTPDHGEPVFYTVKNTGLEKERTMAGELLMKPFERSMLQEGVDLFMDTFSREPWNDVYESREQVVTFFENHMANNCFLGYALFRDGVMLALSIGLKKPYIKGLEYYIDEFCVCAGCQGQGIGTAFLRLIGEDMENQNLRAIMLLTEKGFPSEAFYLKNGFKAYEQLVFMAK